MRGRFESTLALFLKGMKHINRFGEPHGIDGAVSVAAVILDNLKYASAFESFKGLGGRILLAILREREGKPDISARIMRKIPPAAADPMDGLFLFLIGGAALAHYGKYTIFRSDCNRLRRKDWLLNELPRVGCYEIVCALYARVQRV